MSLNSFDEKMKRVEEIASLLSDSNVPLEKSLEYYEEAMSLIKELETKISEAKEKVEKLEK